MTTRDICTDCGDVIETGDLLRGGRRSGDSFIEVRLCVDCLYAVNPYMQQRLIEAAFDIQPTGCTYGTQ